MHYMKIIPEKISLIPIFIFIIKACKRLPEDINERFLRIQSRYNFPYSFLKNSIPHK